MWCFKWWPSGFFNFTQFHQVAGQWEGFLCGGRRLFTTPHGGSGEVVPRMEKGGRGKGFSSLVMNEIPSLRRRNYRVRVIKEGTARGEMLGRGGFVC